MSSPAYPPEPLSIAVCIKQVPLLSSLRFDPQTRRLVREGVMLELNELDVYALSEAIRLRDLHGGEVVAITMGPPQAREVLATALAMGADRALHLNDRSFAGSDTMATAHALAQALRFDAQHHKPFDLIFCGRHSIDAETAQVGPEIAEMLDLPQVSAVQQVTLQSTGERRELLVVRETDEGTESLIVSLPALLTTVEKLNEGIWPDEHAIRAAGEQAGERIQVLSAADLGAEPTQLGERGSPTWVATVEPETFTRAGRIINEDDPTTAIDLLLSDLASRGLLTPQISHVSNTSSETASRRTAPSHTSHGVWIVAELAQRAEGEPQEVRTHTLELLGKGYELATQLQSELAAVLLGGPAVRRHAATLAAYGAWRIFLAEDPALADYTTDAYASVLTDAIQRYQPAVVLFGSTANGRDLAPRIAARLGLGLTGDCIDLSLDQQGRLVQHKPAFGGSIVSLILSRTSPAMATVRAGMLDALVPDFSYAPVIEPLSPGDLNGRQRTRVLARSYQDTGVAELESAHTVLGVGMGLGDPSHYQPLYRLAEQLQAAIGTTRNVADQGWLPKQKQLGLTGRAISPRLYLALGIRGAAEHLAGVRKAGYIVSINKNKRAAIFKHSDLGVVGDVHVLLPILLERLEEHLNG